MKRDMDIIRMILMQQETGQAPPELAKYPSDLVVYNVALMKDAGLLVAEIREDHEGSPRGAVIIRMTWAGHDFLDVTRNDTVWNTAKEKILRSGASWTFDLLKDCLKALAGQQLANIGLPGFDH